MKNLLILLIATLALSFISTETTCQNIRYPYGDASVSSVTIDNDGSATADTTSNVWNTLNFKTVTTDSDITLNLDVGDMMDGSVYYFKVKADTATNITVSFGDNLTGTDETLTASKTDLYRFVWYIDSFYITSAKQAD
ncbi:MAG: hypothetical protein K9J21_06985 [Bacteroidales bacterium]|nr:hypothetical protein [Bacteroidales bacterium]